MPAPTDLTWFQPGSTQLDFINDFAKETVFAGGVGSGKTLSGAFKAVVVSHLYPGTVGLVGRQSYRALEDTTKKVMVYGDDKPAVLDPDLVAHKSEEDNKWILRNGSEILFRSLESHNIEKLLSLNLGWVYVDELTESTLKIWLTLLGRLRHPVGPGIAWGTTNPNGHDWVWQRFHRDASGAVGRLYIQPTESNAKHLRPDYIAMLRTMPKEWQKRYVDASFDTAAGMIWDMWQREVHVYEQAVVGKLPPGWKRFEAMDHGRRNPTAWLWFVVDPDGNIVIEDEYYEADRVPSEHAPSIKAQRATVAPGIRYQSVIAPPDCFRIPPNGGSTIATEYSEHAGISMIPANDNVEAGLLRVAEWLNKDPAHVYPDWHPWRGTKGPDELGAPHLFVSDKCVNLIREVPDYRWRDLGPTQEDTRDQPEEPRKKDDHACDALRYGVMSRPSPYGTRMMHERPKRNTEGRRAVTAGLNERDF